MAKKKMDSPQVDTESITFRCPVEVKRGLEDLAYLSRKGVTALLVELCTSLVTENKKRITSFRQQAVQPIKMPTYAVIKQQKKKNTAPITPSDITPSDELAGGVDNGED